MANSFKRVYTGEADSSIKNQLKELEDLLASESELRKKEIEEQENAYYNARIETLNNIKTATINAYKKQAQMLAKLGTAYDKDSLKKQIDRQKEINARKLKLEIDNLQKNGKKLTAAEQKMLEAKYKKEDEEYEKRATKRFNKDKKRVDALIEYQQTKQDAAALKSVFGKGMSWTERKAAFKEAFGNEDGGTDWLRTFQASITALSDYASSLKSDIESIASQKGTIDTAMQGSRSATDSSGSYWNKMSTNIKKAAAISPLVSQKDIASQVTSLVSIGITFNVEQRAFLAAIKDRIASTFEVNDGYLVQLVKIQQKDTTASRLGMESALTSFLNNMYETSDYMKSVASQVKSNLLEAEALMGATNATEFEYQVHKWAGSMYSLGMNSSSVTSITNALGQLASGDISGISSGGVSNLLIMAANNAGLSIADILADGLDESSTNKLMEAMVNYLAGIYNETKDSKVVAQQYANVFGLKASDLLAANNLSSSVKSVAGNNLSYAGMMNQLTNMTNSMYNRASYGELMSTAASNFQYSLASGIANSPALYALYTAANLLSDTTGGINIGTPLVMGTGITGGFNVADLMRTGALSGSILSGIGQMIAAGSNGGITGSNLLSTFGITGGTTNVTRGGGYSLASSNGTSYSSSGYIGNTSSGDVYSKTMTDANDDANAQVASAVESSTETTLSTVDEHVVNIYNILQAVVDGTSSLHVSFEQGFSLAA